MTSVQDQRGNTTNYSYDPANGHLLTVTDALTNVTSYDYYADTGLLKTVTDPQLHVTQYNYDVTRRVSSIVDPLGTTSFTYDTVTGEQASTTDALMHVTSYGHDADGRLTSITTPDQPNNKTESWTYNSAGLQSLHTNKAGVQDQPTYDSAGRGLVVARTEGVGTALARTALASFDDAGRLIASRDFMARWTNFKLDSMDRTILTTNALGGTSASAFNLDSEETRSRDERGFFSSRLFNSMSEVTQWTDARGYNTSAAYNANGQATSVTDPLNHSIATAYDLVGRVSSVTDAANNTGSYAYWPNAHGALAEYTDPRGFVTHTNLPDYTNKLQTTVCAYGLGAAERPTDCDPCRLARQVNKFCG